MSTHEPTAFPPHTEPDIRSRSSRNGLLALGGAGLAAAGLAAGLMLRPVAAPQPPAAPTLTASTASSLQPVPPQSLAAVPPVVAQASPVQTPATQLPSQHPVTQPAAQTPVARAYIAQSPTPQTPADTLVAQAPTRLRGSDSTQPAPRVTSRHSARADSHRHATHYRHPTTARAAQHTHRVARHTNARTASTMNYSPQRDYASFREPTRYVASCSNCGVVDSVRPVKLLAQPSGVGALAGGVVGGLLGNQVGRGNGRKAMTVIGAVGGGLAGNEVEKRTRGETVYEVRVRMEDGSTRTLQQRTPPTPGARVRVDGDSLRSTSVRDEGPRYVRTGQTY